MSTLNQSSFRNRKPLGVFLFFLDSMLVFRRSIHRCCYPIQVIKRFIWEVTTVLFVHTPLLSVACGKLRKCNLPNESSRGLNWVATCKHVSRIHLFNTTFRNRFRIPSDRYYAVKLKIIPFLSFSVTSRILVLVKKAVTFPPSLPQVKT